ADLYDGCRLLTASALLQCPESKGIVQEGTQHGTKSVFTKRVRCICRLGLIRVTSARTSSCTRWSTWTAIPRPPVSSTRVAVSSIVSGRFISDRLDRLVRPVT